MDIGLFIKELSPDRFEIDINVGEYDLDGDDGLETAVFISMFTDRRVTDEEKPDWSPTKCGWWGDLISEVEGDQIGSKLWLLNREKITVNSLQRHIDVVEECLQWMIDDGVADDVVVDAERIGRNSICVSIEITRPSQPDAKFQIVWQGQELKSYERVI